MQVDQPIGGRNDIAVLFAVDSLTRDWRACGVGVAGAGAGAAGASGAAVKSACYR
jgi:hypothetical protein